MLYVIFDFRITGHNLLNPAKHPPFWCSKGGHPPMRCVIFYSCTLDFLHLFTLIAATVCLFFSRLQMYASHYIGLH